MRVRLRHAAMALVLSTTPGFASGCHVDPFSGVWGVDTDVHMAAKSGEPCRIKMKSGSTSGISISAAAQHGTASLVGNRIVYTPMSGFSGQDAFVFEKYGESFVGERGRHVQGVTHYKVNIDVSP